MAVGGVAVCGALAWGLSQRPNTSSSSTELYNTSNKQPPEGLAALPRDYASIVPVRTGVPVLGPPLPGDLGRTGHRGADSQSRARPPGTRKGGRQDQPAI